MQHDAVPQGAAGCGHGYISFAQEILRGERALPRWGGEEPPGRAGKDHFAAQPSGAGAYVYEVVGGADDVFVVSTTMTCCPVAQLFQYGDELRVSAECKPMEGSSRMYMEPTSELPSEVARLMRWLSPPLSVLLMRLRVRYPSPTCSR